MNIKVFLLGVLAATAVILSLAFAQNRLSAQGDTFFAPIEFVNAGGNVANGAQLSVAEVRMNNGVTCYFASSSGGITSLENLSQIEGLGCVK